MPAPHARITQTLYQGYVRLEFLPDPNVCSSCQGYADPVSGVCMAWFPTWSQCLLLMPGLRRPCIRGMYDLLPDPNACSSYQGYADPVSGVCMAWIPLTWSQCLLLMPGLRRPCIRGMYDLNSSYLIPMPAPHARVTQTLYQGYVWLEFLLPDPNACSSYQGYADPVSGVCTAWIPLTWSQCLLLIPGLRRPCIRGMYGLLPDPNACSSCQGYAGPVSGVCTAWIPPTWSQCLLLMPGLRRPCIRGMYGLNSYLIPMPAPHTRVTQTLYQGYVQLVTWSQCLLLIPGLRRPCIRGMYGLNSSYLIPMPAPHARVTQTLYQGYVQLVTWSQCLLLIPGLRRPCIRGMYGLNSSYLIPMPAPHTRVTQTLYQGYVWLEFLLPDPNACSSYQGYADPVSGVCTAWIPLTWSQCLLLIPGLRRPCIRGMYGLNSSYLIPMPAPHARVMQTLYQGYVRLVTWSQCLLLMPGLRRPCIRGMYGLNSSYLIPMPAPHARVTQTLYQGYVWLEFLLPDPNACSSCQGYADPVSGVCMAWTPLSGPWFQKPPAGHLQNITDLKLECSRNTYVTCSSFDSKAWLLNHTEDTYLCGQYLLLLTFNLLSPTLNTSKNELCKWQNNWNADHLVLLSIYSIGIL